MEYLHTTADSKFDGAWAKGIPLDDEARPPLGNFFRIRDKITCMGCSKTYGPEGFPVIPKKTVMSFNSNSNDVRLPLCFSCAEKLYQQLRQEDPSDELRTLLKFCAVLGLYFDNSIARRVLTEEKIWKKKQDSPWAGKVVSDSVPNWYLYLRALSGDEEASKKDFIHSEDNLSFERVLAAQNEEGIGLGEQAKKSRRAILSIFHYDPFENEPMEERPRLYEDLLTLCDENTGQDLVRAKSAVSLVLSFRNLDRVNKAISDLQATSESIQKNADIIKKLTEQKSKETAMISQFAKDNGFSERYASAKAKGSGTLSAIVRDMDVYGYDDGAVSMFNIEMSKAMQQVSDISAESMFKQLSFTESEYALMVKEQGNVIRQMQKTMKEQAEELRLLKQEHLRAELINRYEKELAEKGLRPEEIAELVSEELKYIPSAIGNTFYTAKELQDAAEEGGDKKMKENI